MGMFPQLHGHTVNSQNSGPNANNRTINDEKKTKRKLKFT